MVQTTSEPREVLLMRLEDQLTVIKMLCRHLAVCHLSSLDTKSHDRISSAVSRAIGDVERPCPYCRGWGGEVYERGFVHLCDHCDCKGWQTREEAKRECVYCGSIGGQIIEMEPGIWHCSDSPECIQVALNRCEEQEIKDLMLDKI
jgi:hypothetical protein